MYVINILTVGNGVSVVLSLYTLFRREISIPNWQRFVALKTSLHFLSKQECSFLQPTCRVSVRQVADIPLFLSRPLFGSGMQRHYEKLFRQLALWRPQCRVTDHPGEMFMTVVQIASFRNACLLQSWRQGFRRLIPNRKTRRSMEYRIVCNIKSTLLRITAYVYVHYDSQQPLFLKQH